MVLVYIYDMDYSKNNRFKSIYIFCLINSFFQITILTYEKVRGNWKRESFCKGYGVTQPNKLKYSIFSHKYVLYHIAVY